MKLQETQTELPEHVLCTGNYAPIEQSNSALRLPFGSANRRSPKFAPLRCANFGRVRLPVGVNKPERMNYSAAGIKKEKGESAR